jgi:hypothetical protein
MKKIYVSTLFSVLGLLCVNGLLAQNSQASLNQVELMKQFIGIWENRSVKDTVYTAEFVPYGTGGLEFTMRGVTGGKVWLEMKELWGYDKKTDKVVIAGLAKNSPYIMLHATWFTAKNKCEQIPMEFASDPARSNFRVEFEFKSPDLVERNEFVNDKSLGVEVYNRVKR